ncbi:MAG: CHAT domain-containing protein [Gemmatimonadota bacterium]|nr:MAG: CHAT domain-containing protein [Gemmatimonadota bacterium]
MKRSRGILLFSILFLTTISTLLAGQTFAGNSQDEIETDILNALEANESDLLTALVRENRHRAYTMAMGLTNDYIAEEVGGNIDLARDKITKAERLALLYDELFGEDYLLERVELYQSWSTTQKVERIEIDSLKFQGKRDYLNSRYDEAMEKFERALELSRALGETWCEACIYIMIGVKFWYQEEYDRSREYYERALTLQEEIGNRKGVGKLLNNIGLIWWQQGDYFQALDIIARSLVVHREVESRTDEANALTNIGILHRNLGHYQQALSCYEEALEIRRETRDKRREGTLLGNIAVAYKCMGRYQESIRLLTQALQRNREVGNRRSEGLNKNEMGEIFIILGQYRRARDYLNQAHDIFGEIEFKKGQGMSLSNMGLAYWYQGDFDEALDHYERALTLHREIDCKPCEAVNVAKIGDVYCQAGDYEKALEQYTAALNMFHEIGDKENEAENYCRLGNLWVDMSDYETAIAHYREGLKIASEIDAPRVLWTAQRGIGRALEEQGEHDDALVHYEQAITTIESLREQLDSEPLKTHYLADKITVYQSLVNLLTERGQIEEAFEYSEQAKARALLDVLSQGKFAVSEDVDTEILIQKRDLQRRLNRLNTRLTQEYLHEEGERDRGRISVLRDSLRLTRMAAEELAGVIHMTYPSSVNVTGISRPLTLREIQEIVLGVGKTEVLVEYLMGEEAMHVWVMRRHEVAYERIEVAQDELKKMVQELRQPFVAFRDGQIVLLPNVPYDVALAHEIYRLVFQPIEKHLRDDEHIVIVPDGILHNLPFEALVVEKGEVKADARTIFSQYENVTYLTEKFAISYAPSASVLNPYLQKKPDLSNIEGELLAFSNPDFGHASQDSIKDAEADMSPLTLLLRSGEGWIFEQLPGAEVEVEVISAVVGTQKTHVFTGAEAKEEVFKERAGRYRTIHLATHSVFEDEEPLYSRIIFALDDDPGEDGFLEVHEIFNLKLNADLVVLSAWETGLGELSAGEGLIGLTRAFMYAGAPSVVVSLWSVGESTCQLMKGFYENLKGGMTKAEALRQAKISMIHTREGGMSYAHPFLWAPFVLVGEWR